MNPEHTYPPCCGEAEGCCWSTLKVSKLSPGKLEVGQSCLQATGCAGTGPGFNCSLGLVSPTLTILWPALPQPDDSKCMSDHRVGSTLCRNHHEGLGGPA